MWRAAVVSCLAAGCAPATYDFVAPELPIRSPLAAALGDGQATAVDGLTKHRWATFSETEACFMSRLYNLTTEDVVPQRSFVLVGFADASEPFDKAPAIASSRVTVKGSGQDDVATDERRMALPHVDVEVCFANPGRVVRADTRYVVLRVPYSTQSESIGSAGSRDGVWRLTR